ncbi:MAG: acyl-CoA dehydrogenase family protein, partial [Acidobacteriota bacterium]|nr:acyl-CoA dehydrogenase family protein [Acidobacteriota bacterium]
MFDSLDRLMTHAETKIDSHRDIDFSLTAEQRAIRDTARAFAQREIDPIVDEIDEAQRFPTELFAHAGELG